MKGHAMSAENVRDVVREKYGQAALRAKTGAGSSCCGGASALESCCDPITSNLYDAGQEGEVPDLAGLEVLAETPGLWVGRQPAHR